MRKNEYDFAYRYGKKCAEDMRAEKTVKADLEGHKKSDAIKWVAVFVLLILVAAIAIGALGIGLGLLKNDSDNSQSEVENSVLLENILPTVQEYGISLAYAVAASDTSVTTSLSLDVEATVLPSNAPQAVSWSYEWTNPESEWASEKKLLDYVSLTVNSSNSRIVTLTVLQPFGEQISVKVVSDADSSKYATITLDYLKSYSLPLYNALRNFSGNTLKLTEGVGSTTGNLSIEWSLNLSPIYDLLKSLSTFNNAYGSYLRTNPIIASGSATTSSFDISLPYNDMSFSSVSGYLGLLWSSSANKSTAELRMYQLLFGSQITSSTFTNAQKNEINEVLNESSFSSLRRPPSYESMFESMGYPYLEVKISNNGLTYSLKTYLVFYGLVSTFPTYVDSVTTDNSAILWGRANY